MCTYTNTDITHTNNNAQGFTFTEKRSTRLIHGYKGMAARRKAKLEFLDLTNLRIPFYNNIYMFIVQDFYLCLFRFTRIITERIARFQLAV